MAPSALRKLIAQQTSRITELELFGNRLRERSRDSFNLIFVNSRIEALNVIWDKARSTHVEILARDEAANEVYITGEVMSKLQILYEDTHEFLLNLKSDLSPALAHVDSEPRNNRITSDVGPRMAKLPKLDLPYFSGKYEDWENFCDLFTTLVHDVPELSNATKLQYLKTCLRGTAADLVKDVTTTNANYSTTWQALKARFHNPRLIVYKHLDALRDMPYLKKESAVELRSFTDEAQRIVRALTNLGMPVEHWDVMTVYLLASRLDPDSRKAWEVELSVKDRRVVLNSNLEMGQANVLDRFPKFADFSEFLEQRCQTLGFITSEKKFDKTLITSSKFIPATRKIHHASTSRSFMDKLSTCPLCSNTHALYQCYRFKAKTPYERRKAVRQLQLCFNCFGEHKVNECTSSGRCASCREKHHTLIHFKSPTKNLSLIKTRGESGNVKDKNTLINQNGVNVNTASILSKSYSVILATAQIKVVGPNGESTRARALLDQGSETSLVSDSIARLIGLKKHRVHIPLTGIGKSPAGTARFATQLTLRSLKDPTLQFETHALVLPKLTSQLPSRRAMDLNLNAFSNLTLADPHFYEPDTIDIILGADVYGQLLRSGVQRFPSSSLIAQDTALGWIVSGPLETSGSGRAEGNPPKMNRILHCTANDSHLNEILERFWTLEDFSTSKSIFNEQEIACEDLFKRTCTRDSKGRFIVRLPLKSEPPAVAEETRRMAIASLAHMHRRFARDSNLAAAYRDFMTTYEKLGHMTRVPDSEIHNSKAWYLPHHAVIQSSSAGSKIRVVFDASRKTVKKECLNDFLMPGPALQRDLSLILLNWRQYKFVFTADIVKMFRQIRVAPEDQDLQRIVWSPNSVDKPIVYRLATVTYGTSCAPYLAIRTLTQLTEEERCRFPLGAKCLDLNTYVDDTFAGANDISVATRTRAELVNILGSAGIELDKWAANHQSLLPSSGSVCQVDGSKPIKDDESVKTLGVRWNPIQDEFGFTTLDFKTLLGASTKRSILSNIARLFDPLGWLAPITVVAKILMQDLWILKCDWDSSLPLDVQDRWTDYCHSLSVLPALSIGRWLGASVGASSQIHGFCDASSRAFAAAVYIRVDEGNGRFRVSLLAAKSKVAPVKTVSIPNLELCGAVLLIKLIKHVRKLEFTQKLPVYTWTDSQIVLTWLKKHPCHWKTFVANRVSLIQTELPESTWSHVPTKENPADLATRGCKAAELIHNNQWWHGPAWLSRENKHWPKETPATQILYTQTPTVEPEILTKFSTLTRLVRVVAYCLRPLVKLRRKRMGQENLPEFLTAPELMSARITVIKICQTHAFATEIKLLQSGKTLTKRHCLLRLDPFIDSNDGILRVGGRLVNSNLTYERKHPPILPHRSVLSQLFVRYAHRICLHGGPSLTSNTLMQHAWVLGRNRVVKTEIRNCITCQRVKPQLAHQMMGNLPNARVTPARPFTSTGLDYAGPIYIRTTKGRGYKSYKGYIALFVCFATRAIHLEAVSDLTTSSFLDAYKRFVGRRGTCKNLYSDNATTFQGADKELRLMFTRASEFHTTTAALLANDGTNWTFIPPNSPHYGGLWEAGVKSVKHHLKRVIGDRTLTFEELSTVLVEIEACLNSRPLSPLSSDTEDLRALTPSHFLIGGASALVPDESPIDIPENRLDRFHLLQSIRNNFWYRWSREYLQHLQERGKWREPTENFAVGQLVLVRDDRYPPSKWPLARIIEIHKGPDDLVRVVTIKTATSILRRHIARLNPLFPNKTLV